MTPSHQSSLFSKGDLDAFGLLLKPSWLSGLLSLVISLAIVIGAVALLHYNGSSWQLLVTAQQAPPTMVGTNSTTFEGEVNDNVLVSSLPLLVFWGGVGIIVYSFIIAVGDAFRNVLELKEEMHYVHANRHFLLRQALFHLVLRVIFLVIWMLYVSYTLHFLLPYVIALAYAGSGGFGLLFNCIYLVGAVVIAAISLHLHTVLLRLLFLKPRMFGQGSEV